MIPPVTVKGWRLWVLHIDFSHSLQRTVQHFPQMIWAWVSTSSCWVCLHGMCQMTSLFWKNPTSLLYMHKLKECFDRSDLKYTRLSSLSLLFPVSKTEKKLSRLLLLQHVHLSVAYYGVCKHVNALAAGWSWLERCDSSGKSLQVKRWVNFNHNLQETNSFLTADILRETGWAIM